MVLRQPNRAGPRERVAVVFDMDGTILRPGSALQRIHMDGMAAAIAQETGIRTRFDRVGTDLAVGGHSLAGFTDAGTIDLALTVGGAGAAELPGLRARVVARMCRDVPPAIAGLRAERELLPGVVPLIDDLATEGVLVGLATGNARRIAAAKVAALGLGTPGALGALHGGFGDDEPDRGKVAGQAVASMRGAAAAVRGVLSRSAILLVGDTASDVRAARAAGVRCLAVGTGAASFEALRAAGPDLLAADLTAVDAAELAAALGSGRPFGDRGSWALSSGRCLDDLGSSALSVPDPAVVLR
jgi:phosphoglycolate phosphatase-like HAD superfamily hydrolase